MEGLVELQSCSTQDVDSSIKFCRPTRLLQAQRRRLLSSAPVGSSLSKGSVLLGSPNGRFVALRPSSSARRNMATDFYTIWARAAQHSRLPLVPVSVQPPLPSFSPNSKQLRRPHQALRSVRSLGLERIDRLDQSAGLNLQILNSAVTISTKQPCDLHTGLLAGRASKPKCCGRPYWTLARLSSTCSV